MPIRITYESDRFGRSSRGVARVHYDSTLSFDALVARVTDGGRWLDAEVRSAFYRVVGAIAEHLANGERVQTPLGTFALGLRPGPEALEHRGTRNRIGSNDDWHIEVHPGRLKMVFRADRSVMKRIRNLARIVRADPVATRIPSIVSVRSLERTTLVGERVMLTEGELVELEGGIFRIDANDPEQGVFLHPRRDASPDGDQSAAIRASVYGHLGSKRIVFKCPAVPPGEYRIAVRMRRKSGAIEEGVGALAVEVGSRSTA